MIPLGTVPFGTVLLNKKQRLNCKSLFFLQLIVKRYQTEPSPMVSFSHNADTYLVEEVDGKRDDC